MAGGCWFDKGSRTGSLLVTCPDHHRATLTYVFTTSRTVQGTAPMPRLADTGRGRVYDSATASGKSIRVTVTVCGDARVQLNTVTVSYYTR